MGFANEREPLTIGFVFDDTLDVLDGVQQHIVTLGEELSRRGHTVHYLVGETHDSPVPNTHSLARNVKVTFNGNQMRIPRPADPRAIRRVLDANHFDILHIQAPYSPFMGGVVLSNADPSTGVVATYHIASANPLAQAGGAALGLINGFTHRRVDEVIAVSQVAAQYATATAHVRGTVIPNPVNVDRFRQAASAGAPGPIDAIMNLKVPFLESVTLGSLLPGRRPRQHAPANQAAPMPAHGNHIVFLGRFVERKGASLLIDALAYAERHGMLPYGTHVSFAGKGPLLEECKARAKALATPVEFLGFVQERDKPALLASADVAVFPSTGGESFGIVLLEAIASGAGVTLGGDNPGYRSTFRGDEDMLFDVTPEGHAQALAGKIAKALTDAGWARDVHARQQRLLARYDVSTVADQVEAVYRRALGRRRGAQ